MTIFEAIVGVSVRYATVPLPLLLAIAEHESCFRQDALNDTGGDAKRGGAYGVFQITRTTAELYLGKLEDPNVLYDVVVGTDLACRIIAQDMVRFDKHIDDVICAYNSGKPKNRAPDITVFKYLPSVKAKYLKYRRLIDGRIKEPKELMVATKC